MNKYKIIYCYFEERFCKPKREYDTIMYDVDTQNVREKFKSKYSHATIKNILVEQNNGNFSKPTKSIDEYIFALKEFTEQYKPFAGMYISNNDNNDEDADLPF